MADAVADKAFLAEAEKAGLDIDFVSGEETAQSFADFYKTPPAVRGQGARDHGPEVAQHSFRAIAVDSKNIPLRS